MTALHLWLTSVKVLWVNQQQRLSITHSHFKSDLHWLAAQSQASFLSVVGNTTVSYLHTNNFRFYTAYMYFQEKFCYDSCYVTACIK